MINDAAMVKRNPSANILTPFSPTLYTKISEASNEQRYVPRFRQQADMLRRFAENIYSELNLRAIAKSTQRFLNVSSRMRTCPRVYGISVPMIYTHCAAWFFNRVAIGFARWVQLIYT